eukprot:scaffold1458_cov377-Prasinococcus_capsulatus_cf.AAC.8
MWCPWRGVILARTNQLWQGAHPNAPPRSAPPRLRRICWRADGAAGEGIRELRHVPVASPRVCDLRHGDRARLWYGSRPQRRTTLA